MKIKTLTVIICAVAFLVSSTSFAVVTNLPCLKNVERYIEAWKGLKGLIDDARYEHILARFEAQRDHAIIWRDSINGYFWKRSGIGDKGK